MKGREEQETSGRQEDGESMEEKETAKGKQRGRKQDREKGSTEEVC